MRQRILNEQFQVLLQQKMLSSPVKLAPVKSAPSTQQTIGKNTKAQNHPKSEDMSEDMADNHRDFKENHNNISSQLLVTEPARA